MKLNKVYLVTPLNFKNDKEIVKSEELAESYRKKIEQTYTCRTLAPHAKLATILNNCIDEEKEMGQRFQMDIFSLCDSVVICGIASWRALPEIKLAYKKNIPVYYYNDETAELIELPPIEKLIKNKELSSF